jgi:hypothetical protein
MLREDRLAQIVPTLNPAQVQFALRFASGLANTSHATTSFLMSVIGTRLCRWSSKEALLRADGMVWVASGSSPPAVQASSAER